MSFLLQLPVELLQQIINHLKYLDIESITLACKHLQNVGKDRLNWHRDTKRHLSGIFVDKYSSGSEIESHPSDILDKILADERIAAYRNRLTVGDCSHYQDNTQFGRDGIRLERDAYVSASGDMLRKRTRQLAELLYQNVEPNNKIFHEWDYFAERVVAGHSSHALALLLTLLPNLKVLRYAYSNFLASPWLEMVSEIGLMGRVYPHAIVPLHQLQRVELLYHLSGCPANLFRNRDYYGPGRWASLIPFVGLPSLQSIYVEGLFICASQWRSAPSNSNITRLTFEDTCVGPHALATLISKVKYFGNLHIIIMIHHMINIGDHV